MHDTQCSARLARLPTLGHARFSTQAMHAQVPMEAALPGASVRGCPTIRILKGGTHTPTVLVDVVCGRALVRRVSSPPPIADGPVPSKRQRIRRRHTSMRAPFECPREHVFANNAADSPDVP